MLHPDAVAALMAGDHGEPFAALGQHQVAHEVSEVGGVLECRVVIDAPENLAKQLVVAWVVLEDLANDRHGIGALH